MKRPKGFGVWKYSRALFVRLVVSGRYTSSPRHFGLPQTPFAPKRSLLLTGSASCQGTGRVFLLWTSQAWAVCLPVLFRLVSTPTIPQNHPEYPIAPSSLAAFRVRMGRTEQITLFICQTMPWLVSCSCYQDPFVALKMHVSWRSVRGVARGGYAPPPTPNYPVSAGQHIHGKKYSNKVYRTVQELGIQAFTEQSSTKFIELFIINMELSIIFPECSAFYIEKFYKFCKTLFRKFLCPQLFNSSINFTKLFFSVYGTFVFIFEWSKYFYFMRKSRYFSKAFRIRCS